MARASKKTKLADLPGQSDPSVELDSAVFLRAAQPVLKQLESDLIARAKASPTVTAALKARHASEKAGKRTADGFAQWQQNFIDQVAAAWLLSCVFVRTLEDRNLLDHPRIAGPGASDSQKLFYQMAPSLTERDYLLTVFRELTNFDAARDLFDAKHNPVWLLTPSAEAAKAMLALFRTPSSDTPAFRFGQPDTRFLGDLYQDLNERVRKRYALLQTPRFVESFILDRTLERAIERFGLDDTTIIDPTCGSGHFLLGSFDRFYEHRLRAEPGLDPRRAAHKALDAVFGADINPYAVGIARFRLTLSFIEKAGFKKLADVPHLPLHLAVADSLLHNPHFHQIAFADLEEQPIGAWNGEEFALEDEKAARDVLHRKYAAVVGNPPYITVKDTALRDRYRELYPKSTGGKYSLAAPFAERFFQLGRDTGYVGMITANSFMKRQFGKKLIKEFLPSVNLEIIVNTAGAYIPGHGTPTVLLFGTAENPKGSDVLVVLAGRGEPTRPEKPAHGRVWQSVANHWSDEGFENDYITVARLQRASLARHPWSLTGGGASELKALLERGSEKTLGDLVDSIGFMAITGEDEAYVADETVFERHGLASRVFGSGEALRDWSISTDRCLLFPYDESWEPFAPEQLLRWLWPYRTLLSRRYYFGKTQLEANLQWFEYRYVGREKIKTPLSIAFAEVATHNHFVLDRGGEVFNRTAPVIKLPDDATEDDHLALLAYLNSSTACFWMKQVCFDKGGGGIGGGLASAEWEKFYVHSASSIEKLPIPKSVLTSPQAAEYSRQLLRLAARAASLVSRESLTAARNAASNWQELQDSLDVAVKERNEVLDALVTVQEECDWWIYFQSGLTRNSELSGAEVDAIGDDAADRSTRPAIATYYRSDAPEREKSRYFEFTGTEPPTEVGARLSVKLRRKWEARLAAISTDKNLRQVERPEFKRTLREVWRAPASGSRVRELVAEEAEDAVRFGCAIRSRRSVMRTVQNRWESLDGAEQPIGSALETAIVEQSVPFLAAYRYEPSGLVKHAIWQRTQDLEREHDAGGRLDEIPAPPKYAQTDFRRSTYWRHRGKLDVPSERFISYPGCESDEDGEPLCGWAGWNHLQRTQALSALYQQRKEHGWRADKEPNSDRDKDDRLIPMLAGLLELLPWVKQWHNEPSEEFDGLRLGDYFERFISGECREFGLTHEDLRNWGPSDKKRRPKKKRGS